MLFWRSKFLSQISRRSETCHGIRFQLNCTRIMRLWTIEITFPGAANRTAISVYNLLLHHCHVKSGLAPHFYDNSSSVYPIFPLRGCDTLFNTTEREEFSACAINSLNNWHKVWTIKCQYSLNNWHKVWTIKCQ